MSVSTPGIENRIQKCFQMHIPTTSGEDEKRTHSGHLLKKRQEARETRENVIQTRKEFEECQSEMRDRRQHLQEKEEQMQHRIQTSIFIKLTVEQRCNAERKAGYYQELIRNREDYLKKLKTEFRDLIRHRKKTVAICIHTRFINAVMKKCPQFQEDYELMDHIERRMARKKFMLESLESTKEEIMKYRETREMFEKQHATAKANHQTQIEIMKSEQETAKQDVQQLEATLDELKTIANMKATQQRDIFLKVSDISQTLSKMGTKLPTPVTLEQVKEALDQIQEFILDMKGIWEKVSEAKSKEN